MPSSVENGRLLHRCRRWDNDRQEDNDRQDNDRRLTRKPPHFGYASAQRKSRYRSRRQGRPVLPPRCPPGRQATDRA